MLFRSDTVYKERIKSLRKMMQEAGMEERREVLVSVLRACSKEGDVEEAKRTWLKLLELLHTKWKFMQRSEKS